MDLNGGEKIVCLGALWLAVEAHADAKQICMVDAGSKLEFVEYGPVGHDGVEFIKVKYGSPNVASGVKEGYVAFWTRRGSTGKGPKDSKIKRPATIH